MQSAYLIKKSGILWNIKNLFSYITMGNENLTFGDIEIVKKIVAIRLLFLGGDGCGHW